MHARLSCRGMPSLLTYCTLFATMVCAIVLRLWWPRFSSGRRRALQLLGLILLTPTLLTMVTKWDVTNHTAWAVEGWIRIVACQFAIVFFTLLRPRLLTSTAALVLITLTFSTIVAGPLSDLFRPVTFSQQHIADRYYLDTHPWESGSGANSGVDFDLYYKQSLSAHLRRGIFGTRLYNSQCRTAATYATLSPATHTLTVHCPMLTVSAANAAGSDTELRYFIPRGALSPELLRQWREDPHPHSNEERTHQ